MSQSFDSTDWDLEARRIACAFDVKGVCKFVSYSPYSETLTLADSHYEVGELESPINTRAGGILRAHASPEKKFYRLQIGQSVSLINLVQINSGIVVSEFRSTGDTTVVMLLGQALCCLDLLTPEVENTLKISISQHEKMEWMLGYEERLKSLHGSLALESV